MNYQTKYRSSPDADLAQRLIDYVASDGMVTSPTGVESTQRDLDGFAAFAKEQEMARFHTISFGSDYSVEELANGAQRVAKEELGGEIEVGIHDSNPNHNHIHIAEAGDYDDLYMDRSDIERVRSALADEFGESIGDHDGSD